MNRIETLRTKVPKDLIDRDELYFLFYECYVSSKGETMEDRYAEAFYHAFSHLTPCIADGELIVGRVENHLSEAQQQLYDTRYELVSDEFWEKYGQGQASHMAIDYELVLQKGIVGILQELDEKPQTPFYRCCRRCLEAVMVYSEHYAALAEHQALTAQPVRKQELLEIARICRKVPAYPAQSFYEAVQSVHFITHCITMNPMRPFNQQFQLGHPDRYLLPYYEKDAITPERAQLLLDCLGIQINLRVQPGLSSGYMVGGRWPDGSPVNNDLTRMCLQVVRDIRLVYPAVGLCWNDDLDEEILDQAVALLADGFSHPAVFGDDLIARGLVQYGVPQQDAYNYIHSTCVEITPVGASNVWVASPYTNMAQLLLDTLEEEYDCFDALMDGFLNRLDETICRNYEYQQKLRKIRAEHAMTPLLSCFVHDCLEKGVDIEKGGARYNWIMPSFVGIGNVVDGLHSIKQAVFQEGLPMERLRAALHRNFAEDEDLRQQLLEGYAKYGNDDDEVDSLFGQITDHIAAQCEKYICVHENGRLVPSVFCWEKHARMGIETGATPDGRKAGFPLGDGSGPCQGRERKGPTASVLSSTKWDHSKYIGGVAVNMKFSKKMLGPEAHTVMKHLIKAYLARGGFELQINVVDAETLKKARQDPEQYRDLIVRIGGYSDYFVRLSDAMQLEVIARTAHEI